MAFTQSEKNGQEINAQAKTGLANSEAKNALEMEKAMEWCEQQNQTFQEKNLLK